MEIRTFRTHEDAEEFFMKESNGQPMEMVFQIKPNNLSKGQFMRMYRAQPRIDITNLTDNLKGEQSMNNNLVQQHKEYCDNLNKVYAQKNEKYGDSFGISVRQYGNIAALTRISDKFHRMEQLILSGKDGSDTDERLEDTLLDMANYCIMTAMELKNKEEK